MLSGSQYYSILWLLPSLSITRSDALFWYTGITEAEFYIHNKQINLSFKKISDVSEKFGKGIKRSSEITLDCAFKTS